MTRPRYRLVHAVLLSVTGASCAPTASTTPLANAEPEGPEVYYYGGASHAGKDLSDVLGTTSDAPATAKGSGKRTAKQKPEKTPPADTQEKDEAGADASTAEETANLPAASFADLPGRYAGTDTLKINVDGQPERVETDDNAKLVVEKAADGRTDAYVFKIVDSQNGSDLCAVTGVVKKRAIEFEPGQTCLDTILGIPMTATLVSGSAKLDGKKLSVDYVIDLELDAPQGTLEGKIDYHFGGTRE